MKRIRELIVTVTQKYPNDQFFAGFEESCRLNMAKRTWYRKYDSTLQLLDKESWQIIKEKAVAHFNDHRRGQLKQGFFHQLNEAFAYNFLVRRGFSNVKILRESGKTTPDIQYFEAGLVKHCEVKTIGLSEEEIKLRETQDVYQNPYANLEEGFFQKLACDVKNAREQIAKQNTSGLIYLIINFDDIALDYYSEYRRKIISFCRDQNMHNLYIKVGLRGNRHINITRG